MPARADLIGQPDDEGEIIDTIYAVPPSSPEVHQMEQCPTCHRYIYRTCSVCPAPLAELPELTEAEKSRAALQREREIAKQIRSDRAR
jgi:hypothetical protein